MTKQIMKKLKEHDKRFDKMDKRFDSHEKRLDTLGNYMLKNTRRIDELSEKVDTLLQRIPEGLHEILDALVGNDKRHDQELIFANEHFKRIDKDIEKIKPLVGLT